MSCKKRNEKILTLIHAQGSEGVFTDSGYDSSAWQEISELVASTFIEFSNNRNEYAKTFRKKDSDSQYKASFLRETMASEAALILTALGKDVHVDTLLPKTASEMELMIINTMLRHSHELSVYKGWNNIFKQVNIFVSKTNE